MLRGTGGELSTTVDTVATQSPYPPKTFVTDEKRSISLPLSGPELPTTAQSASSATAFTITGTSIKDTTPSPTPLPTTTRVLTKAEILVGILLIILIILFTIGMIGFWTRICLRRRIGLSTVRRSKEHVVEVPYSVYERPPVSVVPEGLASDLDSSSDPPDIDDQVLNDALEHHAIEVGSIAGSETSAIQSIANQKNTPSILDEDPFADPVTAPGSSSGPRPPSASTSNASYATTLPVYSEFVDPPASDEINVAGSIERPPSYESKPERIDEGRQRYG